MSHQKVTSKFPTAERLALSDRQQDPPHPNKPPREGRPFLLPSPSKPRRLKPLIEFEVAKRRGSTNSLADNATHKRRNAPSARHRGSNEVSSAQCFATSFRLDASGQSDGFLLSQMPESGMSKAARGKKRPDKKRAPSTHAEAGAKSLNPVMKKIVGRQKFLEQDASIPPATQWRRSTRPSRGVTETARQEFSVSLDTQPRPGDDSDTKAAGFREVRGRRHRDNEIRFLTIAEVAERLRVSTRTVRRWIDVGYLVAHRVGGVVRIAESDLRVFLALHREGS